jgi:hypothetical protein
MHELRQHQRLQLKVLHAQRRTPSSGQVLTLSLLRRYSQVCHPEGARTPREPRDLGFGFLRKVTKDFGKGTALGMADLVAMQPNLNIPLFLVAPEERREKV